MDWISIKNACELLKVSRPTLDVYRRKHRLREAKLGGKVCFSKTELIEKMILPVDWIHERFSLTLFEEYDICQIQPLVGVYDLRMIKAIDAFGVMALLCSIKSYLKNNENQSVHLILDGSPFCSYLKSIGFFTEVERTHRDRVFCNYNALQKHIQSRQAVILPLHLIGYRGAEKKIMDELYDPLLKQGFSEDYCGHIGWIIGELCDNAHTHSEGPCYLIIEAFQESQRKAMHTPSTTTRFLSIAIGDTGIGIPESLRKNQQYKSVKKNILLPLAFQSEVSRMEVEPKRGKGLNDVLGISKGNHSLVRVESGDLALLFDFRSHLEKIKFLPPSVHATGTRFCLVLIDNKFKKVSRESVDQTIHHFLNGV